MPVCGFQSSRWQSHPREISLMFPRLWNNTATLHLHRLVSFCLILLCLQPCFSLCQHAPGFFPPSLLCPITETSVNTCYMRAYSASHECWSTTESRLRDEPKTNTSTWEEDSEQGIPKYRNTIHNSERDERKMKWNLFSFQTSKCVMCNVY